MLRPDHDGAGLGKRLQAGGKVRRLADDPALLRLAGADQVADDDQPGRDADTNPQAARALGAVATASTRARPARTARSASSSCACG